MTQPMQQRAQRPGPRQHSPANGARPDELPDHPVML